MMKILKQNCTLLGIKSRLLASTSTNSTSGVAPAVRVRASSPVEIFANWEESVDFPSNSVQREYGSSKNDNKSEYVLIENKKLSNTKAGSTIRISVPRRCRELYVESEDEITISATDKLEVEKDVQLQSLKALDLSCTVRANSVRLFSDGMITCKGAIDGIEVEMECKGNVQAQRVGAKQLQVRAEGDVSFTSIYGDSIGILSTKGNVELGSTHGHLMLRSEDGNATIQSLSGTIKAEVNGNVRVHIDESFPEAMNMIISSKQAKVSLAIACLPVRVMDNSATVDIKDPDVMYKDNQLSLLRPSSSNGAGNLIVRGDETSSISLLSWVESVMQKASKTTSSI
jgi:hypothetical protein